MLVAVPATGKPGRYPTEVRILATEHGLYVSAILHQPPETLVTRLTNRDEHIDRYSIGVTFDTSGEGIFAYWFTIAPLTDFYMVSNRGNTLPNQVDEDFGELFEAAIQGPIIDYLIVKLRWRFSN